MKKFSPSPVMSGFLQAVGIIVYVLLLNWLFNSGLLNAIVDPILPLLLLCFSALLCGSLALIYPVVLLFAKKPREAVTVIASMIVTMAIIIGAWLTYAAANGPAMMY